MYILWGRYVRWGKIERILLDGSQHTCVVKLSEKETNHWNGICWKHVTTWMTSGPPQWECAYRERSVTYTQQTQDTMSHVNESSRHRDRSLTRAAGSTSNSEEVDDALNCLIRPLKEDTKRNWNSVKICNAYIGYGGSKRSRVRLIKYVSEYIGDDLVVLSSPGIASIILFCSTASTVLKQVDEEDDDLDVKSPRRSRRKLRTFQLIHFTMKPKWTVI